MSLGQGDNEFVYKAFGLVIRSHLLLPELPSGSGEPQVDIDIGTVPDHLQAVRFSNKFFEAGERELLLKIEGVAHYYIQAGRKIVIQPFPGVSERNIRVFLLGSALGALLWQRGILPLHGSAVEKDGRGFVFTGHSGIGKSTLTATLVERGYRFLSDDVVAVQLEKDGQAMVYPAYPQMKLTPTITQLFNIDHHYLETVMDDGCKYCIPLEPDFPEASVSLAAIYALSASPHVNPTDIRVDVLQGAEGLSTILKNTYRPRFAKGLGIMEFRFAVCSEIARQVTVASVKRPKEGLAPYHLGDKVCEHMESLLTIGK